MKYAIAVFVTAVIVFLGATVYYRGLPDFAEPEGVSVTNTEEIAQSGESPEIQLSEEDALAAIIKEVLDEKYSSGSADLSVSVSEIDGEYAYGTVSEDGFGGGWYAARLNGFWTLVWDGNGQIDCVEISPYPEFPKSMIPECWDASTSAVVVRE